MPVALPAGFSADRILVQPVTADGHELNLLVDSAGGHLLLASVVERLGLDVETLETDEAELRLASMPTFRPDRSIPDVLVESDARYGPLRGKLIVMPDEEAVLDGDGILGQTWFGGRRWIIDYPNGRFLVCGPDETVDIDQAHTVPLRFPTNDAGERASSFATIDAEIDGGVLPLLFDTGATLRLADRRPPELDEGPAHRGTCFIVASVFDRWRADHDDWRVVERADAGQEHIIEVPQVSIAGHTAGPVWFTRRADSNFHDWMSQWLDRRVDGALGGSLFRFFVLTADYPNGTLTLTREGNV